ncbi:MAG: M28 family peptidase [Bacteroidetes bacterium]|nr:M28 family peptidase [Bacteroidota bacterium]
MQRVIVILPLLLLPLFGTAAQQPLLTDAVRGAMERVSVERLWHHASVLASDDFEGRGTGSQGERTAAAYISAAMQASGLEPLGDDGGYAQYVPLHGSTPLPDSRLTLVTPTGKRELSLGQDYLLYKTGAQTFIPQPLPLIFVGYGIVAPEYDYNDYQHLDVRDAIVVFLSGEPESDDPRYFEGSQRSIYAIPEMKQRIAFTRGARGSIMIPLPRLGTGYDWEDWQRMFASEDVTLPINVPSNLSVMLRLELAAMLFDGASSSLDDVLRMNANQSMRSFPLDVSMSFSGSFRDRDFLSANIIGLLRGSDPLLQDSYVLCTAHYDHLGIGLPVEGDSIYNGLVDNALGTAAAMELAHVLADSALRPKRSIVFVFLAAEEKGLLGSLYYTSHPAVPLYRTTACLNIDGLAIIDRFHDIVGIGTEYSTLSNLLERLAGELGLRVSEVPPDFSLLDAFASSDQLAFAQAGVPSLLVMEGNDYANVPDQLGYNRFLEWGRTRYHTPFDDTLQPVDRDALTEHAQVLCAVLASLANTYEPPQWIQGSRYINARLQSQAEER